MIDAQAAHRRILASLGAARIAWGRERTADRLEVAPEAKESDSPLDRAALWVDSYFAAVAAGKQPTGLALRRCVADVVALGVQEDEAWAELFAGSPFARHAARVMRLALLIGEGLGLPPRLLQELGVAALLHDIGYLARSFAPGQSSPFAAHVSAGLLALAPQHASTEGLVWRGLATLYHHHPAKALAEIPSLPARVIRVAEDYDRLCHEEGGAKSPTTALALLNGAPEGTYDPILLQLLINGLGRYPPGTCLQLKDGRICWSLSVARKGCFDRPRVYFDDGSTLDLRDEGAVVRVIEP